MFFALLQTAPAVQSKGLIGRQGNAGMRPERRLKPGMDGGLTAAVLVSPPHHLRTADFLSNRWGPPHGYDLLPKSAPSEKLIHRLEFAWFWARARVNWEDSN